MDCAKAAEVQAMTAEELKRIFPFAKKRADTYAPFLTEAMESFSIDTPKRQAAFLAQVGHESGQLRYVEEIADGTAYEGRIDLGNDMPGDGVKYKGHGLIQITGKANHRACGEALGVDALGNPQILTIPRYASLSAAWFWDSRNLNDLADIDDFVRITRRINGGLNGMEDRKQLWEAAKSVLGA